MSVFFKLLTFNEYNEDVEQDVSSSESVNSEEYIPKKDNKQFIMQFFGMDERGKTYTLYIEDYKPFFYIKASDSFRKHEINPFKDYLVEKIGEYYKQSINKISIVKKNTLYGFDNYKLYTFLKIKCNNTIVYNKIKNLFYDKQNKSQEKRLKRGGLRYKQYALELYEANIPPLLRYFHIQNILPSGWVQVDKDKLNHHESKLTTSNYEYTIHYKDLKPYNSDKNVPFKICSFDIEASSSHGDFPLAKKTYSKLVTEILEYWDKIEECSNLSKEKQINKLTELLYISMDISKSINHYISKVYLKNKELTAKQKKEKVDTFINTHGDNILTLLSSKEKLDDKKKSLDSIFTRELPKVEGDKVTFIGSTFKKYGEKEPYLNHCIVLNTCDVIKNAEIEQYDREEDVLMAWTRLIQRENPDIIVGYNIFGFDYIFMFNRCQELGQHYVKDFLKLSRVKDTICAKYENGRYKLEDKSITIASGTHELKYINMTGRVQIDLYNYFRRECNLESYKLDYVSGHFISDKIIDIQNIENKTLFKTKNITGITKNNYIRIEEIGHSTQYYNKGEKLYIEDITEDGSIQLNKIITPDKSKTLKWCLAKDDVSPKDIFELTNRGPSERAIVAKYCIQDCNLVQSLFGKIDVLTGFIEMSNICSVPIDYLVMRGQGIKLFSFIAKKCLESNTLIPVLDKQSSGDYEGAIVLEPKCGLYLDEPVACVDYSSLYPSSMISENISHDSKVWTKIYDTKNNLIQETGIKDMDGNYIYDNLEGYSYVDIEYDLYDKVCVGESKKEEKVVVGKKVCRYAQFPNNGLAIMPKILKDLLAARKYTRTQAKFTTIVTSIGIYNGLKVDECDTSISLKTEDGIKIIEKSSILEMKDTYDDFMKNILDKRQLAIKITANSLYGQCGAKTSSFYEQDVAASTTAIGRKLLLYGKQVIEEVYGDRICETKYGKVHSHAEYIYGDSVLKDTPIIVYDVIKRKINIKTIEELGGIDEYVWHSYNNFKVFDSYLSNRRFKKQSFISNERYLVWTSSGWSSIHRIIKHKCNKKIYRIQTNHSIVDVTEDHSLIDETGKKIKPSQCSIGTRLLYNPLLFGLENKDNYEMKYRKVSDIKYYETKKELSKYVLQSKYPMKIESSRDSQGNEIYSASVHIGLYDNRIKKIELLHNRVGDYVYDIETTDGTFNVGFPLIVKNTDSVFMSFKLTDPNTGEKIVGKEALKHTIELAKEAGKLATKYLKPPHDLEYEKTFLPFCLLSKKRYVGMLYEEDINHCYRKSMGIVLKRRDNAPIVKDVYGGIIDILMNDNDIKKAVEFIYSSLNSIVRGEYPLDKFVITKSLNSHYKNPNTIAHKVLADRISKRDPGNKPSSGDRIPFAYIQTRQKVKLQGERIESPDFIVENNLSLDYHFYITNQIMKPVQQLFALVLKDIPNCYYPISEKRKFQRKENGIKRNYSYLPSKMNAELEKIRNKEVEAILFKRPLQKSKDITNNQMKEKFIGSFFKKVN